MAEMKSKIAILILASVTGLCALSIVQAYLINNTYELRKDAFIEETIEAVTVIDDHLTKIDSIRSEWRDTMLEIVAGHKQGHVTRDSILYYFQLKTDSLNGDFIAAFQEELTKGGFNPLMKFQKKVLTVILVEEAGNDTLYSSTNNQESYLLGQQFTGEGTKISGSTSYSEYSFDNEISGESVPDMIKVNFETETLINIEGWERVVLEEMVGLLVLSIAIFLFVFGVLFYSIRNLIAQKKIAEVKTDFINNISHEFKTPLATLTLATGMLKTNSAKKQPLEETVAIVERQNKRLQKLLNQVLDNSMSHNEIVLDKREVDATDYFQTVLKDFMLSHKGENVVLTQELSLGEKSILIDPFYLTTALLNILDNAVKYNTGEIALNFSASTKERLQITLQDNGIGIASKELKSLFEKFYRVGNKQVHEVKGLGLGLFYAEQIVKAHDGTIVITSKVGEGTTVTMELPINHPI